MNLKQTQESRSRSADAMEKKWIYIADIVVTTSPVDAYMCLHLLRQTIWDREVSVLIIDRKLV